MGTSKKSYNTIFLLVVVAIIFLFIFNCRGSQEPYDPDPQITYASPGMIPEFPTADHFQRNNWTRYDMDSDNYPYSPYNNPSYSDITPYN